MIIIICGLIVMVKKVNKTVKSQIMSKEGWTMFLNQLKERSDYPNVAT